MSRTHDPPSPPFLLSLPLPSLPPFSSLRERHKNPTIPWQKRKNDDSDYFLPNKWVLFLRESPNLAVDPACANMLLPLFPPNKKVYLTL